MSRRLPAISAARAWLEQRHQAPTSGGARELARLLRDADEEQLALARLHEQAAERARVQAQQARDLLAGLVGEGRVSL